MRVEFAFASLLVGVRMPPSAVPVNLPSLFSFPLGLFSRPRPSLSSSPFSVLFFARARLLSFLFLLQFGARSGIAWDMTNGDVGHLAIINGMNGFTYFFW